MSIRSSQVRGITVKDLIAKTDYRVIQNIINAIIESIDAKIVTAHASGFNSIEYELPTNFDINSMNKKDAQTYIYSELLLIYKTPEPSGKGFSNIRINLSSKPTLRVSWLNGMNEEERRRRLNIISINTVDHK